MATRRDLQPPEDSDPVGRVTTPVGYVLGEDERVEDVLAANAELLRSEGIDPTWPGLRELRE